MTCLMVKKTIVFISLLVLICIPDINEGYEDMKCGKDGSQTCRTQIRGEADVGIECKSLQNSDIKIWTYDCTSEVRDWAKPSPYAHTSSTWVCTSGISKLHLFNRDFLTDVDRCVSLCGRCDKGWVMIAPKPQR